MREDLGRDIPDIEAGEAFLKRQWGHFGKKGKIAATRLKGALGNFYFTNAIARASKTMAECSEARGFSAAAQRTGTDG